MARLIGGLLVFVGTYSRNGSKGIYVYRLDEETGKLQFTGETAQERNPSFVVLNPDGSLLFAVNETTKTKGRPGGSVSAYRIDSATGRLTFLNRCASGGRGPCHLSVSTTGDRVFVANYGSGIVAMLGVQEDGFLTGPLHTIQHEGSGPHPRRQRAPHAHSITPDPQTGFVLAADLGIDRVMVYRPDEKLNQLVAADPPAIKLHPGAGPRHLDFSADNQFLYVVNELDSTLSAFRRDPDNSGHFAEIQTLSTLPKGWVVPNNTCADIHVHPNGRFVYASNRVHDSIAIFAIDPKTGRLTARGHEPSRGRLPRNFAIVPSGKLMLVANQDSQNIVVFHIDPDTGELKPAGEEIAVPVPVCIKVLRTGKIR